jgi:hypothetical protein
VWLDYRGTNPCLENSINDELALHSTKLVNIIELPEGFENGPIVFE